MTSRRALTGCTLATAFVVAAVASLSPAALIALGAALGVMVAALAVLRFPRALVLVTVTTAIFAQTVEQLVTSSLASYVDDGLALVAILGLPAIRLLRGQPLRNLPGLWLFLAFGVFGVLSTVLAQVPPIVGFSGGYLATKGFLLGWAAAQVDWSEHDLLALKKPLKIGVAVLLAGAVVNILAPKTWASIFSSTGSPEYRGAIPSIESLFVHPSFFGQVLAAFAIGAFAYQQEVRRKSRLLLVLTTAAALLTFRRKTALSLPVGWIRMWTLRGRVAAPVLLLVVVLPIAALLAAPQLSTIAQETYRVYLEDPGDNARGRLTTDSLEVALDRVPLGAGFGRFGSATAASYYSPEYSARGYETVFGLEPGKANFASDTFWPAVLGEAGLFGALAYAGGLVAIGMYFRQRANATDAQVRFLGVAGSGLLLMLVVESVAAPVFSGPPTYPIIFCLVGLTVARVDVGLSSIEPAGAVSSKGVYH